MSIVNIIDPYAETTEPPAIGIDFGTTNSVVAIATTQNKAVVIPNEQGRELLPSVVAYNNKGCVVVGQEALYMERKKIFSIKRFLGRSLEEVQKILHNCPAIDKHFLSDLSSDENGLLRLQTNTAQYLTAIEISARILLSLKEQAQRYLHSNCYKAVITVPAYFDNVARNAVKDAAKLAGIKVLRLLSEPTAAALAYGLQKNARGVYAVYDLGGGTFDISILKMHEGIFKVIATAGDNALGGDDFDMAIAQMIFTEHADLSENKTSIAQVRLLAREIKEHLTIHDNYQQEVLIQERKYNISITRTAFNTAIDHYVQKTIALARNTLNDTALTVEDVNGVILVGGATRTPAIKENIRNFFQQKVFDDVNPDTIVALGAALQARALTHSEKSNLLLDVLPLSLGIETMGGVVEKIILRNSPIPTEQSQVFTTFQDNQSLMRIHVCQGEREMITQNKSLANFTLYNIPPMPAGLAKIKVTFSIDTNGLLLVTAEEESTGIAQQIEVNPCYGLTQEELQAMVISSFTNAQEDLQQRAILELRVKLQQTIYAIEQALELDKNLINSTEVYEIEQAIKNARISLQDNNVSILEKNITNIETVAHDFIQKRLDNYLQYKVIGHNIDEYKQVENE